MRRTPRKRPGRASRALDDRGGLEVTTVTLRRARPDEASMLSDLALAARDSGATTRHSSSRPGTSSPSVPTTSRDDTSWSPTWAAWWPAATASTAIGRSASWATCGSGRARSAPASAGSCGRTRWPRMADRARQAHAFFRHRTPDQMLVTAAPSSSPWLPEGYGQDYWKAARTSPGAIPISRLLLSLQCMLFG